MDLHDNTLSFDYTVCEANHYITMRRGKPSIFQTNGLYMPLI